MNTPLRAAALALALVLAGCGSGDGDGINPGVAGVDTATAGVAMHGQDVVITLKGRNLDKPVSVAASTGACTALARSAAEPWVSTPETAYYVCTRTQVGEHRALFIRPSDGVLLGDVAFTVPQPQVTLTVDNGAGVQGQLVLTLEATLVPVTVDNFLAYVRSGFYVGTVFHRVVPGFVVQGGGYAQPLAVGDTLPTVKTPGDPIALEDNAGLSNLQWTVAMARTQVLNSANSQFFVNLVDNSFLDRSGSSRGYAVFGKLTAGTDFVTAMVAAPCSAWPAFFGNTSTCLPVPNLVITAASQTR